MKQFSENYKMPTNADRLGTDKHTAKTMAKPIRTNQTFSRLQKALDELSAGKPETFLQMLANRRIYTSKVQSKPFLTYLTTLPTLQPLLLALEKKATNILSLSDAQSDVRLEQYTLLLDKILLSLDQLCADGLQKRAGELIQLLEASELFRKLRQRLCAHIQKASFSGSAVLIQYLFKAGNVDVFRNFCALFPLQSRSAVGQFLFSGCKQAGIYRSFRQLQEATLTFTESTDCDSTSLEQDFAICLIRSNNPRPSNVDFWKPVQDYDDFANDFLLQTLGLSKETLLQVEKTEDLAPREQLAVTLEAFASGARDAKELFKETHALLDCLDRAEIPTAQQATFYSSRLCVQAAQLDPKVTIHTLHELLNRENSTELTRMRSRL